MTSIVRDATTVRKRGRFVRGSQSQRRPWREDFGSGSDMRAPPLCGADSAHRSMAHQRGHVEPPSLQPCSSPQSHARRARALWRQAVVGATSRAGSTILILCVVLICSVSCVSAFTGPYGGILRANAGARSVTGQRLPLGVSPLRMSTRVDLQGGMLPLVTHKPTMSRLKAIKKAKYERILRSTHKECNAAPPQLTTSKPPTVKTVLRTGRQASARLVVLLVWVFLGAAFAMVKGAIAHGMPRKAAAASAEVVTEGVLPPLWRLGVWFFLFIGAAAMAGAETAITTLWPWKVKKIAEEEGADSPFRLLEKDITKFLTAILICTTTATIYSAALVADMAAAYGGERMVTVATLWLTGLTLVFGEIIPKALAVSQAERVSRVMVPIINFVALLVYPVGKLMELTSKAMLMMLGIKDSDDSNVSEEELRMIVMGAKISGEIRSEEQEMIDSVLDLQDTMVSDIMRPRVEVVALEASTDIATFVCAVSSTGYSRFPIFEDNIDNIIGMVLAKNLIDYLDTPTSLDKVTVADIMDPAYYVPQSMAVWNVLEEMRRRRIHMAIVVDEYGGTAGIVTLEDILEEVIGEIYDEDDIDELVKEESSIFREADGSYTIDGFAVLEECVKALDIYIDPADQQKFGTVSGFLCHKAGRIPPIGTRIILFKDPPPSENVPAWCFTVIEADERRIISVKAEPVRPTLPAAALTVSESKYAEDPMSQNIVEI